MRPGQGEHNSPISSPVPQIESTGSWSTVQLNASRDVESQMLQTTTSRRVNIEQYNALQSPSFVTPLLQYQPPFQEAFDSRSDLPRHDMEKAMCSKKKWRTDCRCECDEETELRDNCADTDVIIDSETTRQTNSSIQRIAASGGPDVQVDTWQLSEATVPTEYFRIQTYCDTLSSNERHSLVDSAPTLQAPHYSESIEDNSIPMPSIVYNSSISVTNPTVSDSLHLSVSIRDDHDNDCVSDSLMNNPHLFIDCQISENSESSSYRSKELVQIDPFKDEVFRRFDELSRDALNSSHCDWPSIVSYSVYALSVASMPPPTVQGRQVAIRIIKYARHHKTLNERALMCLNCGHVPELPVTGQCGHTRCAKCIRNNGSCPCGAQPPKSLHVNILIQDLIGNMLLNDICTRDDVKSTEAESGKIKFDEKSVVSTNTKDNLEHMVRRGPIRPLQRQRVRRRILVSGPTSRLASDISARMPMSSQARFEYARELLFSGRYREAVPYLARAAASSQPNARFARTLLTQAITALTVGRDPRRVSRELCRSVRRQGAASWLRRGDLECALCCHTLARPVTTPCGHTYCRTCIERALDYRKMCPLCLRSLDNFNVTTTRETAFVCAALASIDALSTPTPLDPDVIPIFVCTVAYPAIPCPLFIFDPRYWMMLRRILQSGSRKFGMVAYERDRTYSSYGTVLEVCDAVHLEDGRSILSTVGVSRFRVIERDVRDGCEVARIQPLEDVVPTEELAILELRVLATQISHKALLWLNSVNKSVRAEIESAFGQLPSFDHQNEKWWETSSGPVWLWWLIAILPLRSEIKVLILSTTSLQKRMLAVSRTLDVMEQVAITTTSRDLKHRNAVGNQQSIQRGT